MIARLARAHLVEPPTPYIVLLATVAIVVWPRMGIVAVAPMAATVWRFAIERPGTFEVSLPISGRQLYLSRLLATLILFWLPLVAWMVVSLATHQVRLSVLDQSLYLRLDALAIAALAAVVPHVIRPGIIGTPSVRVLIPVSLAAGGGCALAMSFLAPPTALAAIIVAAVVVFVFTLASMPAGFQSASRAYGNRTVATSAPTTRAVRGARAAWWRVMLTSMFSPWYLFGFIFIAASSSLGAYSVLYIFIVTITGIENTRPRTRWLYSLPLSYRRLLLITIAPTVLCVLGGTAVGRLAVRPLRSRVESMNSGAPESSLPSKDYFSNRTGVSLEYWRRPEGSTPTPIVAPWGESITPDTMTVFGMLLYNPFTAGETSSDRFAEWQLGRATAAVYGHAMSVAEYETHRPARVTETPRMVILNGGALVLLMVWILLLIEVGHWYRFATWRRGTLIGASIVALPMFAALAVDAFLGGNRHADLVVPMAEKSLFYLSNVLPSNAAVLVVVVLAPVMMMYLLLERQFARSESTTKLKARSR